MSYQWKKSGVDIAGATNASLVLAGVTTSDAGNYSVFIFNTGGSVSSNTVRLTVTTSPPIITMQPVAQTAVIGGSVSFSVVVENAETYQWSKDGAAIPGATSSTLIVAAITTANAGTYSVVIGNSAGSVTSNSVSLAVSPTISTPPASQIVAAGTDVNLTVVATGAGPLTYQWRKGDIAIAGGTNATLTLRQAAVSASGSYTVIVSNSGGSTTSSPAVLVVNGSRLINLATRGTVGTGDRMLIAGFVVQGTVPKPVLIRAVGPTLAILGVTGAVPDPILELFAGSTSTIVNDNWGGASNAAAIASTAVRVGAFPLGANSADAAILTTLPPGSYTAQVRGASISSGIGLVEIYDASEDSITAPAKLINVATRGEVSAGEGILIAGFYIGGQAPKQVLIRAAGPALAAFGLTNVLTDPRLQLFRGGTVLNENDNWGSPAGTDPADAAKISAAATSVGAFSFATGSRDAALLVTLPPGAYSAQVSGIGNATGLSLVEVYEVP